MATTQWVFRCILFWKFRGAYFRDIFETEFLRFRYSEKEMRFSQVYGFRTDAALKRLKNLWATGELNNVLRLYIQRPSVVL